MAKEKEKTNGAKGFPNKHLHARVSYLHQVATYLATTDLAQTSDLAKNVPYPAQHVAATSGSSGTEEAVLAAEMPRHDVRTWFPAKNFHTSGGSCHSSGQMRQVAQKSQIRLHPALKRASCKICNAVLIESQTCDKYVENLSRGGRKAHADVLVLKCHACGAKKRFPIGATRQPRKPDRPTISPTA